MPDTTSAAAVQIPAAGIYQLDPAASTVTFATRHMFGLAPVKGTFRLVSGQITIADPVTSSTVSAVIDAASFATGNPQRDKDVKSARFLHVRDHPQITFRSTELVRDGDAWGVTADPPPPHRLRDRGELAGSQVERHHRAVLPGLPSLNHQDQVTTAHRPDREAAKGCKPEKTLSSRLPVASCAPKGEWEGYLTRSRNRHDEAKNAESGAWPGRHGDSRRGRAAAGGGARGHGPDRVGGNARAVVDGRAEHR